jgi:periplasmic divalent cation tolerance protein
VSRTNTSEPSLSIVLVTYPAESDYRTWCRSIINRRLAACVNIVKVNSIYWWEENIEESDEVLLIFKTTRDKAEELKEVVMEEHPYKVPEFIEIEADKVGEAYFRWVIDSTSGEK